VIEPYYHAPVAGITIYHGDCLDVLPTLSGIGAVVTDPPYSSGGAFRPRGGGFSNAAEYVVWGSKGPMIDAEVYPPGIFECAIEREREHIAQKPEPVMRWLLGIVPAGAAVLDPFMGSGTTLRAAKDLGLPAIGIEMSEQYCESTAERLRQGVLL